MVEDRITDGKRIAQLLASELTGLERGPLEAVEVTDADPDVEPTAEGALAFRITHENEPIGAVYVTAETVRVTLERKLARVPEREDVTVESTDAETHVVVRSGAAVKTIVDLVVASLDG